MAMDCGGVWLVEQPTNSLMLHHFRLQELLAKICVRRAGIRMGAFGNLTPKPTLLFSNSST
eukprot:1836160-Prorocentrum_lima.AAC.1